MSALVNSSMFVAKNAQVMTDNSNKEMLPTKDEIIQPIEVIRTSWFITNLLY